MFSLFFPPLQSPAAPSLPYGRPPSSQSPPSCNSVRHPQTVNYDRSNRDHPTDKKTDSTRKIASVQTPSLQPTDDASSSPISSLEAELDYERAKISKITDFLLSKGHSMEEICNITGIAPQNDMNQQSLGPNHSPIHIVNEKTIESAAGAVRSGASMEVIKSITTSPQGKKAEIILVLPPIDSTDSVDPSCPAVMGSNIESVEPDDSVQSNESVETVNLVEDNSSCKMNESDDLFNWDGSSWNYKSSGCEKFGYLLTAQQMFVLMSKRLVSSRYRLTPEFLFFEAPCKMAYGLMLIQDLRSFKYKVVNISDIAWRGIFNMELVIVQTNDLIKGRHRDLNMLSLIGRHLYDLSSGSNGVTGSEAVIVNVYPLLRTNVADKTKPYSSGNGFTGLVPTHNGSNPHRKQL